MSRAAQVPSGPNANTAQSELAAAMQACRNALIGVGLFSAVSNILMLTGSVFMLEVYDRVLPSRSVPTLIGLCIIAAFLFAMLGAIDMIRSRIMVRVGASLDEALSGRVYETLIKMPLRAGNRSDGLQPLRDLDNVRSFLSGSGPIAFFDLPWLPVYLAICFIFFHFWIGMAALIGAIILISLTILTEKWTKKPMTDTTQHALARNGLADQIRANPSGWCAQERVFHSTTPGWHAPLSSRAVTLAPWASNCFTCSKFPARAAKINCLSRSAGDKRVVCASTRAPAFCSSCAISL